MTIFKRDWLLMMWGAATLLLGGALVSYHQPFALPADGILALSSPHSERELRAIHFVSAGCRCSQAVMRHLLQRHPVPGVAEEVVVIDGDGVDLPDTAVLLRQLADAGFLVTRIASASIPSGVSLHGVPLLVVASGGGRILYKGGYGVRKNQDTEIISESRAGTLPRLLPVVGCAVGSRVRRSSDPFHLKYR